MRGDSGFVHRERPDTVDSDQRLEFPGHCVHISNVDAWGHDGEWAVWLNTEVSDFDGLCIGLADTREAAIAGALLTLGEAFRLLSRAEGRS